MSNPPTDTVMVRPAREEEVGAILAIWREAHAPPSATDDGDSLIGLIRRDPEALLVAELSGEIVGSLIAGWDGWRGNLYRLAVLPRHRRKGVARRLVREGEQHLRQLGALRINAQVLGGDPMATGFWSAAGFSRDPRMARFVLGGGRLGRRSDETNSPQGAEPER